MTAPTDVAAFHAEFDWHPDDRVGLFDAVAQQLPATTPVLYPGSYVDIAPSVWFDTVTYIDTDKRAARFFAETDAVHELVRDKRRSVATRATELHLRFHHADYTDPVPAQDQSSGLLVSLYAGFISEHCTEALATGGTLLVNPSHGDTAMASIDPRYQLSGVINARSGRYQITTDDLDTYLIPKKRQNVTVEGLHASGRGIAYTRGAFAYLFTRVA